MCFFFFLIFKITHAILNQVWWLSKDLTKDGFWILAVSWVTWLSEEIVAIFLFFVIVWSIWKYRKQNHTPTGQFKLESIYISDEWKVEQMGSYMEFIMGCLIAVWGIEDKSYHKGLLHLMCLVCLPLLHCWMGSMSVVLSNSGGLYVCCGYG